MKVALGVTALLLPLLAAPVFADDDRNGSGNRSRERAESYYETEREYRRRGERFAREERKREEKWLKEQRKREERWLREQRRHGHHDDYSAYPAYVPYLTAPVYSSDGITITPDGIRIWLSL